MSNPVLIFNFQVFLWPLMRTKSYIDAWKVKKGGILWQELKHQQLFAWALAPAGKIECLIRTLQQNSRSTRPRKLFFLFILLYFGGYSNASFKFNQTKSNFFISMVVVLKHLAKEKKTNYFNFIKLLIPFGIFFQNFWAFFYFKNTGTFKFSFNLIAAFGRSFAPLFCTQKQFF